MNQPILTSLNRYDRLIYHNQALPPNIKSLIVNTSQFCRFSSEEITLHNQVIWNTSIDVVAPILFGFVHWCLSQAKSKKIQRLYFMARDGQILWKIAQLINNDWSYGIDCRYLYGSRQAFHFPAIQGIGEVELDWIFSKTQFLSVAIVCERVNLQPQQLELSLEKLYFFKKTWNKNLTQKERLRLKHLFKDPDVASLIVSMATSYRKKAIAYLKQEGVGDGVPFAIVDTGWTGRSQSSFSKLLKAGNIYPDGGTQGFYFGLTECRKAFSTDHLATYFLQPNVPSDRLLLCNHEILESFLAADHGSALRYERQAERYVPILRSERNETSLTWGLTIQQKAILKFTEELLKVSQPQDFDINHCHQITENLLSTFLFNPSREESAVFGVILFSQHQSESKFYELAPAYNFVDCFKIGINFNYVHNFAWLPASAQRSFALTKILLSGLDKTKRGFIYSHLALRCFKQNQNGQAYSFLVKAIKCSPLVLLSKKFIWASIILVLRSVLSPKTYNELRFIFAKK